MAQIIPKLVSHNFKQSYEMYDEVYKTRPYITGGFSSFFGFGGGSIRTQYRKELVDYKTRPVIGICECGEIEKSPCHAKQVIVRTDRLENEYIFN